MTDDKLTETDGRLVCGDGARLAWRRTPGAGPTIVWLGGFHSDMTGNKAQALADWAAASGRDYLRFDYFGHGVSDGDFLDGTIGRWRSDALAVIDELTTGQVVLVGSSMGGWISTLVTLARSERVRGLVLIAPAADFTETLMRPNLPPEALEQLLSDRVWRPPPEQGYPVTQGLLDDGAQWCVLPGPVEINVPVRILQGGADSSVPWRHALALAEAITGEDVVFTLIRDGDHRLSRPEDLQRMLAAVSELSTAASPAR